MKIEVAETRVNAVITPGNPRSELWVLRVTDLKPTSGQR